MTQRTFSVNADVVGHERLGQPVTEELLIGSTSADAQVIVATLRGTAEHAGTEKDIQGYGPTAAEALSSAYNLLELTRTMNDAASTQQAHQH